jgi:acyl-CoA dehydrogenase family protein 10
LRLKDPLIYKAAKLLQQNGIKVAVLSNNYFLTHAKVKTAAIPEIYEFDEVIESCKVGVRKPDKEIFQVCVNLISNNCFLADAHKTWRPATARMCVY